MSVSHVGQLTINMCIVACMTNLPLHKNLIASIVMSEVFDHHICYQQKQKPLSKVLANNENVKMVNVHSNCVDVESYNMIEK